MICFLFCKRIHVRLKSGNKWVVSVIIWALYTWMNHLCKSKLVILLILFTVVKISPNDVNQFVFFHTVWFYHCHVSYTQVSHTNIIPLNFLDVFFHVMCQHEDVSKLDQTGLHLLKFIVSDIQGLSTMATIVQVTLSKTQIFF